MEARFYLQCNLLYFFATALIYTALQGYFTSPGYPNDYSDNDDALKMKSGKAPDLQLCKRESSGHFYV